MRQLLILILIFFNYNSYSQSIMSVLNFGKKNDFQSTKLVSETTTETTFYNTNSIEKQKDITTYNEHNNVTIENRYDKNNNIKQRLTRLYDSTGVRSLGRKLENWHPLLGYTYETTYHQYDSNGFLNGFIEKDQNNNIIRETTIINNDKGYPILLQIFVRNELQGKETAEYNYEKNEVSIKYFNRNQELVNIVNSKIEFTKSMPGDILNEYGDIVKSAKYEMKIKYDKFGNWIKKVYYVLENNKLVKKSETTRIIKYRK